MSGFRPSLMASFLNSGEFEQDMEKRGAEADSMGRNHNAQRRPSRRRRPQSAPPALAVAPPMLFDDDDDDDDGSSGRAGGAGGIGGSSGRSSSLLDGILAKSTAWHNSLSPRALVEAAGSNSFGTIESDKLLSSHTFMLGRNANHKDVQRADLWDEYAECSTSHVQPEAYEADSSETNPEFERSYEERMRWKHETLGLPRMPLKYLKSDISAENVHCSSCFDDSVKFCENTVDMALSFRRLQRPWVRATLSLETPVAKKLAGFDRFIYSTVKRTLDPSVVSVVLERCDAVLDKFPAALAVKQLKERLQQAKLSHADSGNNSKKALKALLTAQLRNLNMYIEAANGKKKRLLAMGQSLEARLKFATFELSRLAGTYPADATNPVLNTGPIQNPLLCHSTDGKEEWNLSRAAPSRACTRQSSTARFLKHTQITYGIDVAQKLVDVARQSFDNRASLSPADIASVVFGSDVHGDDLVRSARVALQDLKQSSAVMTSCSSQLCRARACLWGGFANEDGVLVREPSNTSQLMWSRDLMLLPVVAAIALNNEHSERNLALVRDAMMREAGGVFFASDFFNARALTISIQTSTLLDDCPEFANMKHHEHAISLLNNSITAGFFSTYIKPCFSMDVEANTFAGADIARSIVAASTQFEAQKGNATIDAFVALRISQFELLCNQPCDSHLLFTADRQPLLPLLDSNMKTYEHDLLRLQESIMHSLTIANEKGGVFRSYKGSCIQELTCAPFYAVLNSLQGNSHDVRGYLSMRGGLPDKQTKELQARRDYRLYRDDSARAIQRGNMLINYALLRLQEVSQQKFQDLGIFGSLETSPNLQRAFSIFVPPPGAAEALQQSNTNTMSFESTLGVMGAARGAARTSTQVLEPQSFSVVGAQASGHTRTRKFSHFTEMAINSQQNIAKLALGAQTDLPSTCLVPANAVVANAYFVPILERDRLEKLVGDPSLDPYFRSATDVMNGFDTFPALLQRVGSPVNLGRESPTKRNTADVRNECIQRLMGEVAAAQAKRESFIYDKRSFIYHCIAIVGHFLELQHLCTQDVFKLHADASAKFSLDALLYVEEQSHEIWQDLVKLLKDSHNIFLNEASIPFSSQLSTKQHLRIERAAQTAQKDFVPLQRHALLEDEMLMAIECVDARASLGKPPGFLVHTLQGSFRHWIEEDAEALKMFASAFKHFHGNAVSSELVFQAYARCKRNAWARMFEINCGLHLSFLSSPEVVAFFCLMASKWGTAHEANIARELVDSKFDFVSLSGDRSCILEGVVAKSSIASMWNPVEFLKAAQEPGASKTTWNSNKNNDELMLNTSNDFWEDLTAFRSSNFQDSVASSLEYFKEEINGATFDHASAFVQSTAKMRLFKSKVFDKFELSHEDVAFLMVLFCSMGLERSALEKQLADVFHSIEAHVVKAAQSAFQQIRFQ
jgi:hypothetical protein